MNREQCEAVEDGDRRTCTVSILEQSWLGVRRILEADCEEDDEEQVPSRARSLSLGAAVEADQQDVGVKGALDAATDSIGQQSGGIVQLVRVLRATARRAPGTLYDLHLEVGNSN